MKSVISIFIIVFSLSLLNAQERPNVVFIVVDQWSTRIVDGSGDYANGIETPNIDKLASEGMRFENSYSSFPLCCPARASFYTGLMPHNHGLVDNEEIYHHTIGELPIKQDAKTMGEIFKENGYNTAFFGKEHAGGYGWRGIDNFGSMKYTGGGMLGEGSAYDPVFTSDAAEFIQQEHNKPFYLTLSLINPHDICKVLGGKLKGASYADAIFFCRDDSEPYLRFQERPQLPENHSVEYVDGMIDSNDYMFKDLADRTETEWRQYIATYQLLMENTDRQVGHVLKAIKDSGLEDNTLVIFTADHGEMMGSHGLIAKTIFYEESAKTPLIIKYPSKIEAQTDDNTSFVGSVDLLPTMLDFCGIESSTDFDGKSFKANCTGSAGGFDYVFSENFNGRMVRFGDYKYIISQFGDEEYRILFDLKNDPDETTNVYHHTDYKKISKQAHKVLSGWMEKEGLGNYFVRDYIKM